MATLGERLRGFLGSPRGRRLIEQGQQQLSRPENQQRLRRLLERLRAGRGRGR